MTTDPFNDVVLGFLAGAAVASGAEWYIRKLCRAPEKFPFLAIPFTGLLYRTIQQVSTSGIYGYPANSQLIRAINSSSSILASMFACDLFNIQKELSWKEHCLLIAPGALTALSLWCLYPDNSFIPLAAAVAVSTLYTLNQNKKIVPGAT